MTDSSRPAAGRFLLAITVIASCAFVLVSALVFPPESWGAGRVAATGLVLSSLWISFLALKRKSADVVLGLSGAVGVLCFAHLLLSVRILVYSVHGDANLTIAFSVGALAFGLVILLVANVAAGIIDLNIRRNDTRSEFSRLATDLRELSAQAGDAGLKSELLKLAEELRYYPRRIAQDGTLGPAVMQSMALLRTHVGAGQVEPGRSALGELRRGLEQSRREIESNYSKV